MSDDSHELPPFPSAGWIALIIGGGVVLGIIFLGAIFYCGFRHYKRNQRRRKLLRESRECF